MLTNRMILVAAAVGLAALALAVPARAQVFTGRIDVTVEDATGARRSGVAIDVSGPDTHAQTTDSTGHAHFVNLPVGTYTVKATLTGFAPHTSSSVDVQSGSSTALDVRLKPSGTTEAADVAAVTPVTDVRREAVTTNISVAELQEAPQPRDPWAALQTVPTVYVDRVNVGGSESGQQSDFNAKGAQSTDNTWTLDGVPVTDLGDTLARPELANGASPFYYDIDTVQEIAVRTGGADAQSPTSGAQVNIVLRRGENLPHGSTRFFFADQRLQTTNISSDLAATLGGATAAGNRTDKYQDYGFDLGGPLLKDSVWIWGSMAKTTINLLTLGGAADDTLLSNRALKVEGQWKPGVRGSFTYYDNEKSEDGRDAGPTRPRETTWGQSGPSTLYKGEGTFAMKRLFASVRGAFVHAGIQLAPVGGLARDYYFDDAGVAHGTFYQYQTTRPQHYFGGDASYFAGGVHEVKFGGAWRSTSADTLQTWPASHLVASWAGYPAMLVQVTRDYHAVTSARYIDAYATDTLSFDRATLTAGVRIDRQSSSLGAASVPGVANFESVLPAISATPIDNVFTWTSVTPRISATYAVDAARKTVVRGSYAVFASQLPGSLAAFVSPVQYSYAYYNAVDRNGDGAAQANEVQVSQGLQGFTGFDPKNPSRTTSINQADPSMTAPITHEIAVGADREIAPAFGVSATFTYRRMQDLLWTPLVGATRADYQQTSTLTGTAAEVGAFSVPLYAIRSSAVPAGGGKVATNRPGYHQRYLGFEASAIKRMSKRWTGRVGFSTNSWREYFDDPSTSILDPTPAPAPSVAFPFAGPQVSGGSVVRQAGATSGAATYMVAPGYQLIANGMFTARWGINVAANLVSRQGFAEPFFESDVAAGDPLGRKTVLIARNADDFRLPAVTSVDLRLGKTFNFAITSLAIDFDVFNLFNSATVLARQYDARLTGATGFDQALEVMNPRIARIGIRFAF